MEVYMIERFNADCSYMGYRPVAFCSTLDLVKKYIQENSPCIDGIIVHEYDNLPRETINRWTGFDAIEKIVPNYDTHIQIIYDYRGFYYTYLIRKITLIDCEEFINNPKCKIE